MGIEFGGCEQVLNKLREAEVHISQGIPIAEASREIGVTRQTYYRWRKEYGGLRIEQAKKLKHLEKENARLKKLVADLNEKEIAKHPWQGRYRKILVRNVEKTTGKRPATSNVI